VFCDGLRAPAERCYPWRELAEFLQGIPKFRPIWRLPQHRRCLPKLVERLSVCCPQSFFFSRCLVATVRVNSGGRRFARTLSWAEALALFRDATGRPGPAPWEQGDYPRVQEDFPVSGVSWYEAAAYAEFAGKALPTIYHWVTAASPWIYLRVRWRPDWPRPRPHSACLRCQ
jgi:hypothetical protein